MRSSQSNVKVFALAALTAMGAGLSGCQGRYFYSTTDAGPLALRERYDPLLPQRMANRMLNRTFLETPTLDKIPLGAKNEQGEEIPLDTILARRDAHMTYFKNMYTVLLGEQDSDLYKAALLAESDPDAYLNTFLLKVLEEKADELSFVYNRNRIWPDVLKVLGDMNFDHWSAQTKRQLMEFLLEKKSEDLMMFFAEYELAVGLGMDDEICADRKANLNIALLVIIQDFIRSNPEIFPPEENPSEEQSYELVASL